MKKIKQPMITNSDAGQREVYISSSSKTGDVTSHLACVTIDEEITLDKLLDTSFLPEIEELVKEVQAAASTYTTRAVRRLTNGLGENILEFHDKYNTICKVKAVFESLEKRKTTILELTVQLKKEKSRIDNQGTETQSSFINNNLDHDTASSLTGNINHRVIVEEGARIGNIEVKTACISLAKQTFFQKQLSDKGFLYGAMDLLDSLENTKYTTPHMEELRTKLSDAIDIYNKNIKIAEQHKSAIRDLEEAKKAIIQLYNNLKIQKSTIDQESLNKNSFSPI